MGRIGRALWRGGAFFTALLIAVFLREQGDAVDMAIIWLPTGVAVAGLWLLGLRYWWVVAAATLVQRASLGYYPSVAFPAALGSTAEAVCGVLVLRRLGCRGRFDSLRDVLALFAAALLAPLASVLGSYLGRLFLWTHPDMPFYSGWDGWWRMNALGLLAVVPVALTWLGAPVARPRTRDMLEALLVALVTGAILWSVMTAVPAGTTAVILLFLVLPVALYAAVRFGPRGAASTAVIAAVVVAILATHGLGPFMVVPKPERHVAIQVFEVMLVAIPLVLGALLAEREVSAARQLESDVAREAFERLIPDITYRIRADGTYLDAHVPPGAIVTVPLGEILGHRVREVVPHAAAMMESAIAAALRGEQPAPVEYEVVRGGQRRMREARYVRLNDQEVLGLVRDITERRRAEQVLAWQAEVLERIATAQSLPDIFDLLGRGIEGLCDGGLASVLQLEGRLVSVAWAPGLPAAYSAALEGREIGPAAGSCGTAAHENRTVVVSDIATDPLWAAYRDLALGHGLRACWSVPIRAPGGQVLGTFAIYYREPRAPGAGEIALVERAAVLAGIAMDRAQREDLLASINRNVNEGLYRSTPERGLVYVNQAFARMFGYASPEEMLVLTSGMLYEDPDRREQLKRQITAHGFFVNEEVRFRRRDGAVFWGLVSSTGIPGTDGQVAYYDGAVADITARKALEEQLRQAQKMEAVGKLAGGIAHDFNNLLTAISGYAEAIREAVPAAGEVRADVEEVLKAADRAASLTRQLLAYSRQQVLSPRVLDLTAVVEHLGGMLRRLIGEDIRLVIRHHAGDSHVRVDRSQLEQVILNLVVNARDAMPAGGTLTIATTAVEVDEALAGRQVDLEPGPYVALAVQDTGVGMANEVQRRAFDPFFTTKEQGKGTGLGLSTVYGIVKQSGGAVWLESAPGAGTTVSIYLPRVAAAPEVLDAAAPEPAAAPRGTVLVVEDERMVRDLVRRTLARAGYQVLEAADGEAALALARTEPGTIDLLLTDVVMPRLGGRQLAARLQAERPGLRVLFMSGYASDAGDLHDLVLGAGDFLQKPFAPSRLLERVGALLAPGTVPG
ncbi:MAG: MASE1 domain-containing protein [Gemmatimonadetes bacterium]|nr:MASE1 domain-containing protein [Gemmatimonadota bacterium]